MGIVTGPQFKHTDVVMDPGDRLVLYSDGLIDANHKRGHPSLDAESLVVGLPEGSSASAITYLEQRAQLLGVQTPADDVAVLVATNAARRLSSPPPAPPADSSPEDPADIGVVESSSRTENEQILCGRPDTQPNVAIVCECGHVGCRALLDVPQALYEHVRADEHCFFVLPGHELPRAEEVRERHHGVLVVRKHGRAARGADQADSDRER